jgi:AGCS family alanine or glycine:cation symporter
MALPNLIGLYVMHTEVKENLKAYIKKWKSGELDRECIAKEVCEI